MKIYWTAAQDIFGTRKAEKWLDDNSEHLSCEAKTVAEAKWEVYGLLGTNRHLSNSYELHPDNGTWANYLKTETLKATHNGYKWYVSANEHYILHPTGYIQTRHGYHGYNLWADVTGLSYDQVYERGEFAPSKTVGKYTVTQKLDSFTGKIEALIVASPKNTRTFYLLPDDAQQVFLALAVERDVVGLINSSLVLWES